MSDSPLVPAKSIASQHPDGTEPASPTPRGQDSIIAEKPKPDVFRKSADSDFDRVKKPEQFGIKILQRAKQVAAGNRRVHTFNPQVFRQLIKERVFQQSTLRDSRLFSLIKGRAFENRSESKPEEAKQNIRQLFNMRQQISDRGALRQVIRHEIQQLRNQLKSTNQGTKTSPSMLAEKIKNQVGESEFENVLKQVLQGKESIKGLAQGKKAQFAAKSAEGWKSFFAGVLQQGSVEKAAAQKNSAIGDMLFRGMFKQLSQEPGMTLVSDIRLADSSSLMAHKFARVLVDNPALLALLAGLKPGDPISGELLKRLGEELHYTRLVHHVEVLSAEAHDAQSQAALAQLRGMVNVEAQKRTENQLLEQRRAREEAKRSPGFMHDEKDGLLGPPKKNPWFFFGGEYKWHERYRGRPKPAVLFLYAIGGFTLGLLGYLLARFFL